MKNILKQVKARLAHTRVSLPCGAERLTSDGNADRKYAVLGRFCEEKRIDRFFLPESPKTRFTLEKYDVFRKHARFTPYFRCEEKEYTKGITK